MIESIKFTNFKVLRDTTLPLGPFTLLVGPNGSGKSTALQPFVSLPVGHQFVFEHVASAEAKKQVDAAVEIQIRFSQHLQNMLYSLRVLQGQRIPTSNGKWKNASGGEVSPNKQTQELWQLLARVRVYSLDPRYLPIAVSLNPNQELIAEQPSLAGVLDRLRDLAPERFEALNAELAQMLPEFDRILFETPSPGSRTFLLRTREGHHRIPASDLSQGTLLALAIVTLAYLPDPPPLIGLEEPDRGIHPRLLRQLRDALYRLAYPKDFGEDRAPVQVIATTQSPYFLDLFKDHPEEIVIAEKKGLEAQFKPLKDHPHIDEIIADAPLGEIWYSGVLGGVPSGS
jgi:predicted ATPase